MSSGGQAMMRRALMAAVGLWAGLWAGARPGAAQEEEPKGPKSVEVEVFVIMASKGEVEHTDPALKDLSELLKTKFGSLYNRFRLHKSSRNEVKRDRMTQFPLVSDYILWVQYHEVRKDEGQEKVVLTLKLVKMVEVTDEKGNKKKKEVAVSVPLKSSMEREKFLLIGGQEVGEETMFLAVRVLK